MGESEGRRTGQRQSMHEKNLLVPKSAYEHLPAQYMPIKKQV